MKDTFAIRLQKALDLKGIKAADLARLSNTPESVISQYKSGRYVPKQRRLEQFSKILGVSIPFLMGDDTEEDMVKDKLIKQSIDIINDLSPEAREIALEQLKSLSKLSKKKDID